MFLRSTSIDADPRRIDDGISWVRSTVRPLVEPLEGNLGLLMLVARASGRVVVASAWGTRAAMQQSERQILGIRNESVRVFGAEPVVEEWELAELHRVRQAQDGFASRATRVDLDPRDVDLLVETFRATSIPALGLLPGFCGAGLMVDRAHGKAVSMVTFESRAAMEDSRPRAAEIRQASVEKAHARPTEVIELEVVIAGVRIPSEGSGLT
jgi:hypothetical protein